MTEKTVEIQFPEHAVTCVIPSDKSGATHFKFELAPKVKFENGKATEAHAHWGKIEVRRLLKVRFGPLQQPTTRSICFRARLSIK